ncbi:hypothetical protein ACEPPN_002174 [Leptodophora sp. 'Broadleaf-Isolate-01']
MTFEILEGSDEDLALVAEIFIAAMLKDRQWYSLMRDVKVEDWLVVGYTVLGLPGNFTKEQVEASSGIPPMPEGVNQVMLKGMVALIGISKKYGYDSTKHYHRKGIAVLPEYQRRGIARMLSEHLNGIADAEGGEIYVVTTPVSMLLFSTQGFEIIGTESVDMTEFGGTPAEGNNYVMLRRSMGRALQASILK